MRHLHTTAAYLRMRQDLRTLVQRVRRPEVDVHADARREGDRIEDVEKDFVVGHVRVESA